MLRYRFIAILAPLILSTAFAHEGPHSGKPKEITADQHPWGMQGDPRKVKRTIAVDMSDKMRFSPSEIRVKRGETVKFVVTNSGTTLHEMVLGTEDALRKHADLMKQFPGMEHDEPYMAHVKPGAREEITWTFNRPGTFSYGCLIPGHWEAGMKGRVIVAAN
jgi:uncharacterized cupredoxin-like copper-binding protein